MAATVRIEIPYGDEAISFDVHSANLQGIYEPRQVPPAPDAEAEIRRALANPIGQPLLQELARGARRVVLVADDSTRLTPTDLIVPILLDALNKAGVPDDAIEVLIALGTHRKMTAQEIAYQVRLPGDAPSARRQP